MFLFLSLLSLCYAANQDRACSDDISNLWLDIVIVVDKSVQMSDGRLLQVSENLQNIFGNGTRIGTEYSDPRSTRIEVVSFTDKAKIEADMNHFQSYEQFSSNIFPLLKNDIRTDEEAFIDIGLEKSLELFTNSRKNFKKVVILYTTSSNQSLSITPIMEDFKRHDIQLLVINCHKTPGIFRLYSTQYFSFSITSSTLITDIRKSLLKINCFCPINWSKQRDDNLSVLSLDHGTCIRAIDTRVTWNAAKDACHRLGAFLVNDFGVFKKILMHGLVVNHFAPPHSYHIGLGYFNKTWSWQQLEGVEMKKLELGGNDVDIEQWPKNYPKIQKSSWAPGFPHSASTKYGVVHMVSNKRKSNGWQNINPDTVSAYYICEMPSCDATNYCL